MRLPARNPRPESNEMAYASLFHEFRRIVDQHPKSGSLPHWIHFPFVLPLSAIARGGYAPPTRIRQRRGEHAVWVGLDAAGVPAAVLGAESNYIARPRPSSPPMACLPRAP